MSDVPHNDQTRSIGVVIDVAERKRAEDALRASEVRYRDLFESTRDAITLLEPSSGRFVSANPGAVKLFGAKDEGDFLSRRPWEHSPELQPDGRASAEKAHEMIELAMRVGSHLFEWTHKRANGSEFPAEVLLTPVVQGEETLIYANVRDITERKQTEQALRDAALYARSLIEASLDPLVTISPDGKITDVNEAAVRITGVPREALVGSDYSIYVTEPEKARAGTQEVFAKGFVTDLPLAIRHASGKTTDVLFNASIYRDSKGEVVGDVAVARDITELKQAERALERLNRTLRTLSAASAAVVRATTEEELLDDMCRVGVEVGGYRLAWIGFVGQDGTKSVRPVAWVGEHPEFLETANITWAETERGLGPTGTAIRTGEAQINQDVTANPIMAPWRADMLRYDFKASVALPLKHKSEVLGSITFYSGEADAFGPEEVTLLTELAADLAFGIYARREHAGRETANAALQESLKSTVEAIATAVEMRDAYTAGHQRRVAELATAIAREIGLTKWQIEGIFLAGTIHDVGKINVPAELLSKPGKLTSLEYQMLQTHVQTGYDIIKGINFPWPIAQIILQHHERLDGSGYPNRLKGEAILIEARILGVADVMEAMLAHRPYRPALGLDAALEEIEAGKRRLYDPAVADACIALFRQKGFEFH